MKQKFIVKVPLHPLDNNTEYKEFKFNTRKDVTDFLKISTNTFNTMLNHELKCAQVKHQHLIGIQIERIHDESIPQFPVDATEFQKQLLLYETETEKEQKENILPEDFVVDDFVRDSKNGMKISELRFKYKLSLEQVRILRKKYELGKKI